MAYLGQPPFQEFTNPPTKDSFTGDGSTTTFDMDVEVPSSAQNALEVYVDNVRQEPGTGKAFTLGPDGSNDIKRITFSSAPANAASIYVINDKTNVSVTAPLNNDLNGTELILDGDGDTSITADTDDRIDFRIAAADHFHIGTSSGDTVFQNRTDAKDFLFNQYDGRTILEINDAGYVAIANGATGPGQLRIYEDTDLGTNFTAFQVGTQAADITYTLPTADGSSGQAITTNGSGVLTFSTVAANTPTSADGQALGSASLEWSDLFLADGGVINLGADQDTTLTHVADTGILLNSTRQLQFGDSGTYIHQSADGVLDLVSDTEIEINATTIDINGAVQISGTTTIVGNLILGSASLNEASLEILDGATVTTTELNIMDGGTSASSTTVADADRVVFNDGGTMKQVAVTDLAAYFDDEITAMPNLVTTAATTVGVLGSGSIAAGFGAIDNGASNITSGGLVSLDVDADADDVTGDSATGRLTLGAGQDLNLYHGGTNSYIVNDTGDLILKTGASDEDMIFQGNDGGAAITALTLDMSAAGAATFNSTVAATGFIIGSANIGEAELEILDGLAATTAELTVIDGDTSATGTTVADADRVVMNDNGTMVQVAVTDLAAYFDDEITAMPNLITTAATTVGALDSGSITSGFTSIDVGAGAITTTGTGTIGNLVVDDVAVNGKVITMTGSSGDTFVTTVAANGATSLVTTDAAAAAAHLQITADGTVDIDSAGVLTLDSGAAINIEPAAGSAILLDGTISVDAGVVTGATSITSTAFVGGLTGNVTGNASGTALTVTQAAQTAITSVGTLTALAVDNITINGNTISTTNTNGTLEISPNGTGDVNVLSDALTIQGVEGEGVSLNLQADQFDDNADMWSFIHAADNNLKISSYASGASVVQMQLTPNSTVMNSTTMVAGILDLIGTTDSSDASGDTGILRVEGGASIAKKLYIGTDLDVDGTANLDIVDIDGAVNIAAAVTQSGGVFTQDGGAIFNEASADVDFRVESNTDTHALYVNGEGDSVALGYTGKLSSVYTTDGGTTITGNTLTVYKSGANTPGILELGGNSNVENQYVGAISFVNNENSNSGAYERKNIATITAQLRTANSNSGNNSGGDLVFWNKQNVESNYETLRLTHDGRGLSQFTAKAWGRVDMSNMSLNDSHNVGSVTDVSTGRAGINFSNNLANANYSTPVSASEGYRSATKSHATGSFTINHTDTNGNLADANDASFVVFGD